MIGHETYQSFEENTRFAESNVFRGSPLTARGVESPFWETLSKVSLDVLKYRSCPESKTRGLAGRDLKAILIAVMSPLKSER